MDAPPEVSVVLLVRGEAFRSGGSGSSPRRSPGEVGPHLDALRSLHAHVYSVGMRVVFDVTIVRADDADAFRGECERLFEGCDVHIAAGAHANMHEGLWHSLRLLEGEGTTHVVLTRPDFVWTRRVPHVYDDRVGSAYFFPHGHHYANDVIPVTDTLLILPMAFLPVLRTHLEKAIGDRKFRGASLHWLGKVTDVRNLSGGRAHPNHPNPYHTRAGRRATSAVAAAR